MLAVSPAASQLVLRAQCDVCCLLHTCCLCRTTSVTNLMYVKEDIILPQTITFYDLIVNKAQGKSGPLFQFDLHEHAVASFDPRVKSQDSHAGDEKGST